ncbi:helix-turn-helix domain-containing protein [Spartinivicinus ruber]|uniref:helix-turn-helix domain-containing protein n=1 Tax=Spartinivicinus ruber TaxID=2683272 RepID=UPI0013D42C23|nr:helix-turn-helix transcriptional regulator [Spartinivicinus ruber]
MTEKNSELKDRIRVSRQALGFSQQEVADKLGVTKSAVGAWEQGRNDPSKLVMKELANILDTPLEWLESDETYITDDWIETGFEKNSEFKDRLKVVRKFRKLTQKELAEQLHITPAAVAAWETGRSRPNEVIIKRVSEIFDCPYKWLSSDEVALGKKWKAGINEDSSSPPNIVEDSASKTYGQKAVADEAGFVEEISKLSIRMTKLAFEKRVTASDIQMLKAFLDVIENRQDKK